MGLDMFLYGVKYNCKVENDIEPSLALVEIGYWRKANAVHRWFVENIQDGVDNCAMYYVYKSELGELLAICKAITKDRSRASELLPTQEGFFFGDTEYNSWYWDDINETIEIISNCLDSEYEYFVYRSSW